MIYKDYKKSVAYQGSEGANSHLLCASKFPHAKHHSFDTFDEVFHAVESGKIALGIVPIENSNAGRVSEIHNLLKGTSLHIVGEFFLEIRHHLAAIADSDITQITDVYSHPQALMQSNQSVKSLSLSKHSFFNTALAAKYVNKEQDPTKAALCTELAATLNNLKIIKYDMQDAEKNNTIFIALAKEVEELSINKSAKKVTTLLFTVRNIPAAIYKCLGGFATNNINIIKLESYIPGGLSEEASFFISFEGDVDERSVQLALEELGFYSKDIKLLGVYDKAVERK